MPEEKDIIKRLAETGIKNYPIKHAEVQDGVLVKIIIEIGDKEVIITR